MDRKALDWLMGWMGRLEVQGCSGDWNQGTASSDNRAKSPRRVPYVVSHVCSLAREGLESGHQDPQHCLHQGRDNSLKEHEVTTQASWETGYILWVEGRP